MTTNANLEAAINAKFDAAPAVERWTVTTIGEINHILRYMSDERENGDNPNYDTDLQMTVDAVDASSEWAMAAHGDHYRAGEMPIAWSRDEDGYWLVWGFDEVTR